MKRSLPDINELSGLKKFKTKTVVVYNLEKPAEKNGIHFVPKAEFALNLNREA